MSAWLALAYAALVLGLGWALAGGGDWRRRAPYVVLTPMVALALWLGRPNPAGWPTAGRIYLWLDVGRHAPRAYALPYSRALHEQVQRVLKRVAHGQPVALGRADARAGRGAHAELVGQA
jgi:hypothetical protein